MKKTKIVAALSGIGLFALATVLMSSDHIDAPNVAGTSADIADFYAFEGENPDKTVFIVEVQGILAPGLVTENANFDEDVLIEINIDNTGDFKEDLVLQAIKRGDSMYFFGPATPIEIGLSSTILTEEEPHIVQLSTTEDTYVLNEDEISFFAGPRRDAFYFDLDRFNNITAGATVPDGFFPEGEAVDFFANTNTLAIVVEIPNSLLGEAPTHVLATQAGMNDLPPAYNVWVTTKIKQ